MNPADGAGHEPSPRAKELFAAWRARHEHGDADDFGTLCEAHPELRAELEMLAGGEGAPPSNEDELDRSDGTERLSWIAARDVAAARYELRGEIGRGGMGKVLEVWDGDLRRTLAMKVLTEAAAHAGAVDARQRQALARFLEEAQVTGQLDHPGVVPVHELGVDAEDVVYFTMRRVKGHDLRQIVERVERGEEGWSLTRVLSVVLRVCDTMAFAHAKGVVHRDLKPSNVMVGRFGEVYVMDWGLASVVGRESLARDIRLRREDSVSLSEVVTDRRDATDEEADSPLVTLDGAVIGTPAYMSPEQASGRIEAVGPLSDVYSVGALMYHVLTGRMPYVDPGARMSSHTVLAMVIQGPPRPVGELAPEVPAEVVAICEKAMSREPSKRYASMGEMADDLRRYFDHRVVLAYGGGAWAELKKWVQRNQALAAASAAAVLLGFVALIGIGWSQAAGRREEFLTADTFRLPFYVSESERLYPAHPDRAGEMIAWLESARELSARLDVHVERLEEASARAAGSEDDTLHEELRAQTALVEGLRAFGDPDPAVGTIARVEERLEFATTVRERSLTGEKAARRWAEAVASIADRTACPKYGGLRVEPQLGLLPIGRDARSGLWEFAHLRTGRPAERDASGELIVTEATGLVFVLVPGGSVHLGAAPAGEHNVDPQAKPGESPVHVVELDPYFLSKYEMTQAQWMRATGEEPSSYPPGHKLVDPVRGALHPVEQISWSEGDLRLRNLGLILPSEAQWERAARGGNEHVWSSGDDRADLEGYANLADRAAVRAGADWDDPEDWPELDDGWAVHAPVGSFAPNPYGLHDVHGNVWEWCRDLRAPYTQPAAEGDGVREPAASSRYRVYRGGSFRETASESRSAYRFHDGARVQENDVGVRPARALDQ